MMKFFKRFHTQVIIRIALLITNIFIIAAIFGDQRLFFNQIILGILLIIQTWDLFRYVNHTNRELTRFFLAIKHSDFSVTFQQGDLGQAFRNLSRSMSDVIDAYKVVKIEKEAQFHFLQMMVSQLQIGLIALRDDTITLINPAAENLLGLDGVKNWKLLTQVNPSFTKEIDDLGGNGRRLIEIKTSTGKKFISAQVTTLIILDHSNRLITLQDINSEIEQKEIEAWHKLIRILTHEIMNSVTPISSLTETMQSLLEDKSGNQKLLPDITSENITDIRFALRTIQKRSDGLLHFIENYRKLTRVPKPVFENVNVRDFLHSLDKLMRPDLQQKGINLQVTCPDWISISADPSLIEQVLINLITNSIHALSHISATPQINIECVRESHHVVIRVTDNGAGINSKEITEIFTPFFSTRKEGSGIGLSLSKQIMSLHQGSIKVESQPGLGTTMVLIFKANV